MLPPFLAFTFLRRRPVCSQLLCISSCLSRREPIRPSAIQNRNYNVAEFVQNRNCNVAEFVRQPRMITPAVLRSRDLSISRGRGGGMDGEGESTTSLTSISDSKREEEVVEGAEKIEREEEVDDEDGKKIDDKLQEEVESSVGTSFRLTGSCSLVLHRGDITKWFKDGKTDAIVNAANSRMLGGGGVDGAIHRAAGSGLLEACQKVPKVSSGVRCPVGRAVITPGFMLPVAHVIHTVGPVYYIEMDPASLLSEAYRNTVALATENKLKYIAFPAISCGVYGYPYEEAAEISIQVLKESAGQLSEVHFVFFEAGTYAAWLTEAEEKLEKLSI